MTWFMAGAAVVTVGTTYLSGQSNKASQIRGLNSASKAEGEAIVRERLNTTIRNSYSTALSQMQLSLKKRQLTQQGADISAAALAARGDADAVNAATGSIGASTQAIVSDIDQKSQAAIDQTRDAFENSVDNYNRELDMMVLNTDVSAPQVRTPEYLGPSNGEILGGALFAGVSQFASSYAMKKMSLGLGDKPAPKVGEPINGFGIGSSGLGLRVPR